MRAYVVAMLLSLGCEGKKSTPPPVLPKDAAAVVTLDATRVIDAEVVTAQRPPRAVEVREAALPKRTPCKATCDEQHMSPAAGACYRRAQEHDDMAGTADITLIGERSKGPCIPTSVVIDCCPAYKPTDLKGIAKRLGWATANVEERKAIAWVIARVVVGGQIIDEDYDAPQAKDLARPVTVEDHGKVTLEYWLIPDGGHEPEIVHQVLIFAANGEVASTSDKRQELDRP